MSARPKKIREVHPVAALFPMLAADELAELAEDIKQRGLLHPVVLDGEGRILDGRNRLAACELAGVEPTFITYGGDDADGYALAVNIARRHLTTGARAIIAAKAARLSGVGKSAQSRDMDIERKRLSEAALVLDWSTHDDLANEVIANITPLSKAVETARERKKTDAEKQAKIQRLKASAADLVSLVDEERMSLDDAVAALDAREDKARQVAHAESVERARDIDDARRAAQSIIGEFQARVASIVIGAQHGETGLVDKDAIAHLREAVNLLEEVL